MGTVRKVRRWWPRIHTPPRSRTGAAQALAGVLDPEVHVPLLEVLANVVVADDTEGVIQ